MRPLEVAVATLERLRTLVFGINLPASGAGLRVSMSAGLRRVTRKCVRLMSSLHERMPLSMLRRMKGAIWCESPTRNS